MKINLQTQYDKLTLTFQNRNNIIKLDLEV